MHNWCTTWNIINMISLKKAQPLKATITTKSNQRLYFFLRHFIHLFQNSKVQITNKTWEFHVHILSIWMIMSVIRVYIHGCPLSVHSNRKWIQISFKAKWYSSIFSLVTKYNCNVYFYSINILFHVKNHIFINALDIYRNE